MKRARPILIASLGVLGIALLLMIGGLSVSQAAPENTQIIYDDVLAYRWEDWSWGSTIDFANQTQVKNGANAIAVTCHVAWAGLDLHSETLLTPTDYEDLHFWIYGSGAGNPLKVQFIDEDDQEAGDPVYITASAGTWTLFEIPIADFHYPAGKFISGVAWVDNSGGSQPVFYLDDLIMENPNDTPTPTPTMTPTATPVAPSQHPFPQHVTYSPGSIMPNHRSQSQLDDDVRAFYDYWKSRYLMDAGTNAQGEQMYRVSYGDVNPDRTVSEGQGYGMVLTAMMAGYDGQAQVYFDGLWRYARAHPSDVDPRLMGWQIPPDPETGNDSAFDGDADIAYGLLLAHAQWGDAGDVDYLGEAQTYITAIKESTIGPDSKLTELGDWVVDGDGDGYNQWTPRSADFMNGHFRTYGRATHDEIFWDQVVTAVQSDIDGIQATYSPNTGLLPDFIVRESSTDYAPRPAPPDFLEGPHDGDYDYNAGRDPWRIGTDALLNNDAKSFAQAQKMATWIVQSTDGNPAAIKPGYTLDGTPYDDYFTSFFVSPFGVGVMTTPGNQSYLNSLYDLIYQRHEDYYEDSVTLLSLLVMTGNFWDPYDAPPQTPAVTIDLDGATPRLTWRHRTGNLFYQIWRNNAPYFDPDSAASATLLETAPAPGVAEMSFEDSSLPAGENAYYCLRGVNRPGATSTCSNEVGIVRFTLIPGA